jgi:hypothetical protein
VTVELDTFSRNVSRVRYGGRWYTIFSPGIGTLFVVVPLGLVALALVVLNALPAARPVARRMVAKRLWVRVIAIVIGLLVALFCVALAVVGRGDSGYPGGAGQLFDRYAHFTINGYFEGARVKSEDLGSTTAVDSSDLYALAPADGSKVPVLLWTDSANKITTVSDGDRSVYVGNPRWYALPVVIPVGLLALALVILNGAAIARSRRAAVPA